MWTPCRVLSGAGEFTSFAAKLSGVVVYTTQFFGVKCSLLWQLVRKQSVCSTVFPVENFHTLTQMQIILRMCSNLGSIRLLFTLHCSARRLRKIDVKEVIHKRHMHRNNCHTLQYLFLLDFRALRVHVTSLPHTTRLHGRVSLV